MGRRARTNCSPIDSVMEKYHNDIGSRLSGVFVPVQSGLDNSGVNSTDAAVNMFTLDMRSKAHNHDNNHNNMVNSFTNQDNTGPSVQSSHTDSKCERDSSPTQFPISCQNSEKSQTLPSSLNQTPSLAMSIALKSQESHSCTEDGKEKRGLVDKLTRALFQRKHTCTRCQRKSRSCVPNKNFTSTEKHYMCGRCRESNSAMKNLVSGQTVPANGVPLNNPNSDDREVILHKPRTHLKDSGYETVTSCSTVASSHSHNSTINGSSPKSHIRSGRVEDLSHMDNNGTPYLEGSTSNQQFSTHGLTGQTSYGNPTAALEQYMGVTGDDSSVRILKQVKTRYFENYDGYLPNTQTTQACVVKRPALPASGAPSSTEGVDTTVNDNNRSTFSSTDQERAHPVHTGCTNSKKPTKVCYTCGSSSKPCFRLPWKGGWLCEDCLDGVF